MGNEQASRIVQAPGIETNQDELARPPIVRYSIGDEDTELFSEHRTPGVPLGMSLTKHHVRQIIDFRYRSRQRSSEPPKNVTLLLLLLVVVVAAAAAVVVTFDTLFAERRYQHSVTVPSST